MEDKIIKNIVSKTEDEKKSFIEKLHKFNCESNIGITVSEVKDLEKFKVVYSNLISDYWWNFIYSIKANNKEELDRVIDLAEREMNKINRKMCISISSIDGDIYEKKEQFFKSNQYELLCSESWQIYTDFENVENIKTNCDLDITIEKANDMSLFGIINDRAFCTGKDYDPYAEIDTLYMDVYKKYKPINKDYIQEFYFIKYENKVIGVTRVLYNEEIFGIYGLAIFSEYRNKGIGKNVVKQLLNMCKKLNKKVALLQTEKGFYPEKIYIKMGFKEICTDYYYQKK